MIVELGAITLLGYGAYSLIYRDRVKFEYKLKQLYYRDTDFINRQEEIPVLVKYDKVSYGHKAILDIGNVIGFTKLQEKEDSIKTFFKARDINLNLNSEGLVELELITEPLEDLKYQPVKTEPFELYVGYGYKDHIKINLNSFPHMLIGGDSGSGKSRFLMLALTNLINQHRNVELYLCQIRKSDLAVFGQCKQTKYVARSLKDTRDLLRHIQGECKRREKLLEKYLMEGVYNIQDFNNKFPSAALKYLYVVLDEFAFYNISGADTKEDKVLKKEILGLIKEVVNVGRSSGVFAITSLQKPTSSSIPTDIKAQLCTRVSFKMLDKETSIIILGNANATKLKVREGIVRTIEEDNIKVPFIDHNLIMEHIKASIEPNHKYINISPKTMKEGAELNNVIPIDNFRNDGVIDLKILNAN